MPQIVLKIAQVTDEIFDPAQRVTLLEVSRNLIDLRWSYRPGDGGLWAGETRFRLKPDTRAWRQIKRGRYGLAMIYWEPESGRDMATFDANEANRLLWIGTLENARIDPEDAEICEAELKGAGEFLQEIVVNMADDGNSAHGGLDTISNLAGNAADQAQAFDDRFDLFSTDFIAAVGACARKAYLDEEDATVSEAFSKLASRVGGSSVLAWGARPAGDGDDMCSIYFQPWASSLWERSASFEVPSWHIGPGQLLKLQIGRRTRDVHNVIDVYGEKEGWPVFRNRAQSGPSIARHGVRKLRVTDTTARTLGELADIASGHLEEKATARLDVSLEFEESLDRGNQGDHADGEEAGLLQTALAQGARPITVMLRDLTQPAKIGENTFTARLIQQSAVGNCLAIDTSHAGLTVGLWHPCPDISSGSYISTSTEGQLHVIQGKFTGSNPAGAVNLWELDRHVSIGLIQNSGDNYRVICLQRRAAGWTVIGTGPIDIPWTLGAAGTNLDEYHAWGIEIENTGTTAPESIIVYRVDANGTQTAVASFTVPAAQDAGVGTDDLILVNGALGTGGGALTTNSNSRSFDCYGFDVFARATNEFGDFTAQTMLTDIATMRDTFKYARHRILHLELGLTSAGTGISGTDQCWVSFGFPEAAPSGDEPTHFGGFHCSLLSSSGSAGFLTDSSSPASSNDWLLGGGTYKRHLGAGLELLPRTVDVEYQGRNSPLRVSIQGDAPASRLTGALQAIQDDLSSLTRAKNGV